MRGLAGEPKLMSRIPVRLFVVFSLVVIYSEAFGGEMSCKVKNCLDLLRRTGGLNLWIIMNWMLCCRMRQN